MRALDRSVSVEHLNDVAPQMSQRSTPDWYVYCLAVESGFDALVVRDRSQLDQMTEMYVLSRLPTLTARPIGQAENWPHFTIQRPLQIQNWPHRQRRGQF